MLNNQLMTVAFDDVQQM